MENNTMSDIVFNLITEENKRQLEGIELIASENYVSGNVLRAVGSVLMNKYAEGYPGHRYYGGCEVIDKIESLAIDRAKQLFNVGYVNVQPHSGSQANAAAFGSVLNIGDKLLSLSLDCGGHLTHGTDVSFSGKLYQAFHYGVSQNGIIDMNEVFSIADKVRPQAIVCGASSYSRDWDYKRFREIADYCGAVLIADIAHPAGLIACGLLNDPFDYCHIVTTTTHKTLRGPRGGMIMMRHDIPNPLGITKKGKIKMLSEVIDANVFPGNQGGPLEHVIAGKAVAFQEALSTEYKTYISLVKEYTSYLANLFMENGYDIVSNGTDNHLILIKLENKGISGLEAEIALGKAGITVNKNMIPYDKKTPNITSGIRIGTAAIISRNCSKDDINKIYHIIDEVLKHHNDDAYLRKVRETVISDITSHLIDRSLC